MSSKFKYPRPVMMVPLRRCGSHAIRLRLNANKNFYAPYPIHVVDILPLLPLYGDLNNDKAYFQLITDLIGLQSGLMVKWPDISLDPVVIFDRIKDQPRSIHRIIWEMLFIAGDKQGASVVMDKSLDSIHSADELLKIFPDMLFINVVRDPRAQIASMNKAIIHDFDTLLNAQTWVKAYEKGRKLQDMYPDQVLTIRFEDFVDNEILVIKRICEFLSIEFSDDMLDIESSSEAKSISTRSALWECNSSAPIAANVDKFKAVLSDHEINVIETITHEYMEYYGYARMSTENLTITSHDYELASEKSIKKKQKAWNDLCVNQQQDYVLRKFRLDYIEMIKNRFKIETELDEVCA